MKWTVLFKDPKRIEKAVDKLRPSTQVAFRRAIQDLQTEGPSPGGWRTKPLKGEMAGFFSLRLDYRHRMIYEVSHGILTITIIEVSTREGAYYRRIFYDS
jgi:mRNA-degrading endonuclease RelE of RelBE toxin-antitoxin system